jgi:predicted AlkP superfamily pyrophosphatase or phosphodiesterase
MTSAALLRVARKGRRATLELSHTVHRVPSFAAIPGYLERLLTGGGETLPGLPDRADRVVLVLLDAFGTVFRERFAAHPLVKRLTVCELESQFPSTTAAHVTTMHSGLPVERHGVYEWNVYEPSLDRVVTPLRFSFAGDRDGDTLRGHFDPRDLVPAEPCLYERLAAHGVVSLVYQPDVFSPSTFDSAAIRAADIRPFRDLADGLRDALRSVAALERGYAYVYFHAIDLVGHLSGPSSDDFADAVRLALDAVEAALAEAGDDTLVLLTADHGQVDVDPARTIWLDELHPPLAGMRLRPAGSARDVFLHVDDPDAVIAALSPHLEAVRAETLFGDIGPRLADRLADVCVLPPPGRMAWLRSAPDFAVRFRGHHGGRTPEETQTYLAMVG